MKYVGIKIFDAEADFYSKNPRNYNIKGENGQIIRVEYCKDFDNLTYEMAYFMMKRGYFVGRKKWNGDYLRITNSRIKKCLVDTSRLWIDYVPLNQDQLIDDWRVVK